MLRSGEHVLEGPGTVINTRYASYCAVDCVEEGPRESLSVLSCIRISLIVNSSPISLDR